MASREKGLLRFQRHLAGAVVVFTQSSRENNMRRVFLFVVVVCGICVPAVSQSSSSYPQTLQAILTEVRAFRQDLRVSLARVQNIQILLTRFQIQQGVVSRASERLDDARSRLSETQIHQRDVVAESKRLEDELSAEENPQQQKLLQDRISHTKSEMEVTANMEHQRQAAEIQTEQQLLDEQDKLNALEAQLDELIRKMSSSVEQSGQSHP